MGIIGWLIMQLISCTVLIVLAPVVFTITMECFYLLMGATGMRFRPINPSSFGRVWYGFWGRVLRGGAALLWPYLKTGASIAAALALVAFLRTRAQLMPLAAAGVARVRYEVTTRRQKRIP